MVIIVCVVAVIGSGRKNGIEIERVDAQRLEIRQLFNNPQQIATLKTVVGGCCAPGLQILGFGQVAVLPETAALGEPIREYLVEYSVFNPIWGCYIHEVFLLDTHHYRRFFCRFSIYFKERVPI